MPTAAPPSQLTGRGPVPWIGVNGNNPAAWALDVEPGDATPSTAASWALHKLSGGPHLHDGFGVAERAGGSRPRCALTSAGGLPTPTGGPHIVPGSSATQWYWGSKYDVSTVPSDF